MNGAAGASRSPSDDAPHLLVVDDDSRIRLLLGRFLGNRGLRVTTAASAIEARRQLSMIRFDLLIIDVMMPGESGLELTTSLRQSSDVPILLLTAKADPQDRIQGLEVGADDYVPKPFAPQELLLRINNILRRASYPLSVRRNVVHFGPFTFDSTRGELRRGDELVRLTDRERDVLRIFAARPGEAVRRTELGSSEQNQGERTIDVQINRLRQKIEADPSSPVYLQTARGIGYRLMAD